MENLVTNMSFWGIAAIIATTGQLIWEYFSAKGRIQVAKVASLSHQSRSLFEHHYKSFTLISVGVLALLALNIWVLPHMYYVVLAPGIDRSAVLAALRRNGVAAVFVSWWEGELDHDVMHANLNKTVDPSDLKTAVEVG